MTRDKGIFQKGSERQGMNVNPPVTKTIQPSPNSWTAFIARVKEMCQGTSDMNKKDYSAAMQWYINGKSAESFVVDKNAKENEK